MQGKGRKKRGSQRGEENRNYPYGKEQALRIGIIDADLLYRKRHRFPNLACMKLSAYWKEQGFETELLLDYSQAGEYDWLYVSKVFTDTFVPEHILTRETTVYGGTGFFYDKAPVLQEAIEHHTPDYHLYDQMVKEHSEGEKKKKEFQFSRCQKFHLPFLHNPQIQPLPELKPPACFQDTGKDFFPPCTGKKVIVQKA